MSRHLKILILILFAVGVNRICSLVPSAYYFDPFPFYDLVYYGENVGINMQAFCYALTVHISFLLILIAFREALPHMAMVFTLFAILELLSVADFLLIYEQALFRIGKWGVEFTDFKIIAYGTIIILWKTGRL